MQPTKCRVGVGASFTTRPRLRPGYTDGNWEQRGVEPHIEWSIGRLRQEKEIREIQMLATEPVL